MIMVLQSVDIAGQWATNTPNHKSMRAFTLGNVGSSFMVMIGNACPMTFIPFNSMEGMWKAWGAVCIP